MADFLSFLPLASETIDSVRARLDADANAGVDPTSTDWIDTTEGGFWFDLTQAVALEIQRLWDFAATEVPAAAFPAFAWGDYLDEHGEALGLERKAASAATGTVRFTGDDGSLIATGAQVSTSPADLTEDAVSYVTTADGTIASGTADIPVEAAFAGAQGNALANTVTLLVTPVAGVTDVTNPSIISGGADVETDDDYRERILLDLSTPGGDGNADDYRRWALAYPGIGGVTVTPVWNGPGTVHVVVVDQDHNPVSDAVRFGLQDELDPPQYLTSATAGVTLSGSPQTLSVVSTTGFAASGSLRVHGDAAAYTGKTSTTFTGVTGSGTYVTGARVEQGFDQGGGKAPIGAVVKVDTVTVTTVNVAATVTPVAGYSLDGSAGTIALRTDLQNEITSYINGLDPGQSVILNHVIARFFDIRGVADVSGVQLNGSAANVTVSSTAVARTGTITLS